MPSYKRPKLNRRALPQVIDPPTMRCIPVSIPDDPEWLAAFVGAIDRMGLRTAWDYDPATVADLTTVSDRWRDISADVQQIILDNVQCEAATPSDPQDCTVINAIHPSIGYFPNHPTLTPDAGEPIWPAPAWCTNCNIPGIGLATDTLVRIDAAPFFIDFADLLASGVPSFTLHFSGAGQVDLRFASVPVGGTVWVFPDGNPLVGQMVDLEWIDLDDFAGSALIEILIGLLQGSLVNQTTVTHEITFDTGGSHTLTGWFFPKVEAVEWPPIGWGGGLRDIQLCGDSIVLEDAPMNIDIQCAAGQLELLVDSVVKTTIDLDVCHPHPVDPDWTLNRNNGDLQLLKDLVLHDSVPFPNYNTSYNQLTHLLELLRDSVIVDTTPLPSYTLVKPDPATIQLKRNATINESSVTDENSVYRLQENGDQHELTEDGLVVSTVTDDKSEAADVITWHEKEWDFGGQATSFSDRFQIQGDGLYVANTGYNSVWDSGQAEQRLRLLLTNENQETLVKIRLKVVASATVASGRLRIWHTYGSFTINLGSDENFNGVEERVFERAIDFMYNGSDVLTIDYIETGAVSDGVFLISEIALMALDYPLAPEDSLTSNQVIHNGIAEAWSI